MLNQIQASSVSRLQQKKQPLPEYGKLYFKNLCGEYHSLPPARIKPEEKAIIDTILDKDKTDSLNWNDLYTFDLTLARLQPLEKLPRIVWSLRSRYRDVAGLREYDAYLASKPPELTPDPREEDLQADIEYLMGQLHLRYAMSSVRGGIRDWLSKAIFYMTLAGLIVVIVFVLLAHKAGEEETNSPIKILGVDVSNIEASTLIVVLFMGAMGGLVSIQQRFQSVSDEGDPINNISELAWGWFSIYLSPTSGAVFAALLYVIITAGLLEGELFPEIISDEAGTFISFLLETSPAKDADYAKLLIWSFIAGFAERFVPDTLSRFVEKRETTRGTGV